MQKWFLSGLACLVSKRVHTAKSQSELYVLDLYSLSAAHFHVNYVCLSMAVGGVGCRIRA